MIIKLLTEHHLEFLSLKGGCTQRLIRVYTCQNATLLEIACTGSDVFYLTRLSTGNVASADPEGGQGVRTPSPPWKITSYMGFYRE